MKWSGTLNWKRLILLNWSKKEGLKEEMSPQIERY
jgi:hypothetical protein